MFSRLSKFALGRQPVQGGDGMVPDPAALPPMIQGYVDERSNTHIAGWMRNVNDPGERVAFDVVIERPDAAPEIIGHGQADQLSDVLQQLSVGDARYAFRFTYAATVPSADLRYLVVRPAGSSTTLELAPPYQGYVDERSTHHIAGWVRDRFIPDDRIEVEIVLPAGDGERILATTVAEEFNAPLAQIGIGDARYGFHVQFREPLTETERDTVVVRPVGSKTTLELAPALLTEYQPIGHIAMDIVNNCNLRCPFCVYDYAGVNRTKTMEDSTFDAMLRLLPFVHDGNFWLSCLHEATMHPKLLRFLERIPRQWRRKVMYTTNLARPMPDAYFTALADSGLHHINISLESLVPEIYERMRKGARWRIFSKNWDRLLAALQAGSAPPRLRYNMMAYRSNLAEIPGLVRTLRAEKLAWQVEIRHTFDVAHIPAEFREAEFLAPADWAWLQDQLAEFSPDEVLLIPPPETIDAADDLPLAEQAAEPENDPDAEPLIDSLAIAAEAPDAGRTVPHPLSIRVEWDGKLIVYGEWTGLARTVRHPNGLPEHQQFVITNIHHLRDPIRFLTGL